MPPKPTECVKVMVRTRPMNQKEFDRGKSKMQSTLISRNKLIDIDINYIYFYNIRKYENRIKW